MILVSILILSARTAAAAGAAYRKSQNKTNNCKNSQSFNFHLITSFHQILTILTRHIVFIKQYIYGII